MNPIPDPHGEDGADDGAPRFVLDARRLEREPEADLWPQIAERLQTGSRLPFDATTAARRRRRSLLLALAASVVAVIGTMLGLLALQPRESLPTTAAAPAAAPLPSALLAADVRGENRGLLKANLKLVGNAEDELRRALRDDPDALYLQRLLAAAEHRQCELQKLLGAACV
jgi:hypothetical protein